MPMMMSVSPWARERRSSRLLLRRPEPAQGPDSDRIVRQALLEGPAVLFHQDGGGGQDGHLLAVLNRLEGGPDRHLRLSVTHVPANQSVHGPFDAPCPS